MKKRLLSYSLCKFMFEHFHEFQLSGAPTHQPIIETKNTGPENFYIRSLKFNCEQIENCRIDRKKLMRGGTLVFEMDSTPNEQWGINSPPPSMSDEQKYR